MWEEESRRGRRKEEKREHMLTDSRRQFECKMRKCRTETERDREGKRKKERGRERGID